MLTMCVVYRDTRGHTMPVVQWVLSKILFAPGPAARRGVSESQTGDVDGPTQLA